MNKTVAVVIVFAIVFGLVGNSYAHKAEVIGDYKIEVGWKHEPPIVGQANAIEIIVTIATEHDKESAVSQEHDESIEHEGMTHEEHEEEMEMMKEKELEEEMEHEEHLEDGTGVSGLSDKLEATVSMEGKKTELLLVEQSKPGVYHADYVPADVGFPSVNLVGEIEQTVFERTFHPEKVEDLSALPPLKQVTANISPNDVQCKEGFQLMLSNNGKPACVSPTTASKLEIRGWGTII